MNYCNIMLIMLTFSVWVLLLPLVHSQLDQFPSWVTSPDYPLEYPNNISRNWSACAPAGFSVSLTLIHLDLANSTRCEHDALKITSGKHLNMSLCGSISYKELQSTVNPKLFSTSGGCLSIYFHSDDSDPQAHAGFRALYQLQDIDECASQNKPCSHFCYNFMGGFRCSCPHGYLLNPNNNTCTAIDCGEPESLLNRKVNFVSGSNNEYLSVINYHCNEPYYTDKGINNASILETYICSADQKWKQNEAGIVPSCSPVCGQHKLSSFGRVLGGKNASLGSFPWQVLLKPTKKLIAGAFIIEEKWLMTAAHNFKPPFSMENVKAFVGHNIRKEEDKFITLSISSIHVHPGYNNPNNQNYDNDIALIKLNTPITFTENVRPVCLPSQDAELNNVGMVSGFGLITETKIAQRLQYVKLPIVNQKTCRDSFENVMRKNRVEIPPLTDNMFCAGFEEGGKDACSGDSGSAFVLKQKGVHYAVGIVSWGLDCGTPGLYGVYTRITRYLDWINKTMSEN